jgi:S1-C subfamily serine protease
MRWMLFFVGLLLGNLLACVPSPASAESPAFDVARSARVTVALVDDSDVADGPRSFCTGVWVSDTSILTAAHCVRENVLGDVIKYGVTKDISGATLIVFSAKLYAVDEANDLALLRSTTPHGPEHAKVAARVSQGERSHTMGMPMRAWWSYTQGVIAAVRTSDIDGTGPRLWVQTTAPTSPGNSGGGLFNDAGELVGIAHGATGGRAQNMNWYVHPKNISAFLALQGAL